jgi:hypothetical protein
MKIETKENQIILKEVYNSITLETREGKQLHICMRDMGFEMKVDDGEWYLLTDESDFLIKPRNLIRSDNVALHITSDDKQSF